MTDYPDWQTPAAHATAIYAQQVPLARKPINIFTASATEAASGTATLATQASVNQQGYQLYLNLEQTVVNGAYPFGRLKLQWWDSASLFAMQPDTFWLSAGQIALTAALITGPARGDLVTVTLDNLDPGQLLSYSIAMTAVSHDYKVARMIQLDGAAINGFTLPGRNPQAAVLASEAPSVTTATPVDRLAAAWSGQAVLNVDNVGQPNDAHVALMDPGVVLGSTALYNAASTGILAGLRVTGGQTGTITVALPPGPVVIRTTNLGSSGNIQPTTSLFRVDE